MRIALAFALIVCAGSAAFAQPEFEVASVRPSDPTESVSDWTIHEGVRVDMHNVTLRRCVLLAYGIKDYQLMGPDWLKSERFDIVAKAASAVSDEKIMSMLQKLLADRFHLAFHRVERVLPIYALVVAKGGPKMRESAPGGEPRQQSISGHLTAQGSKISQVVAPLSRLLNRPVVNETGLDGAFDLNLQWDFADPGSVFPAIQQQLGLKLEPRKQSFQVFVIDSIDRVPVAN